MTSPSAPFHSALEGAGFKLVGSRFNGSGDRVGTVMLHHYTLSRPMGNTSVTHHVYVDQFGRHPDKPNVSYSVTHAGVPLADGYFSTLRRHRDNSAIGGVKDPIGEILAHHRWADATLRQQKPRPLVDVTPENMHTLNPDWPVHTVGGGLESEIHRGSDPRNKMQSFNSVRGCSDCDREAMNDADEDLRP